MNMLRALSLAACTAVFVTILAPIAAAQDPGPGGQRGQGGQRGERGQRQGMMGRQGGGDLMLLARNDVQKDLKLTDDQKTKLTNLRESFQSEMQAMFQNAGGDRQAMQQQMQAKMAEMQKQVDGILTDAQKTRIKQIGVQMQGNRIAMNPEYAEKLKITADQRAKMRDLQEKSQAARQALMEKVRSGEMDREQMQTTMRKNNEILDAELGKILTADQKKLIAEWSGPKFEMDPNERGGFGFGGRGGGN